VFVVGYLDQDEPSPGPTRTNSASGPTTPGTVPSDQAVDWTGDLFLQDLSSVDWDSRPQPVRNPSGIGADIYVWPDAEISGPYTMVRWTKAETPSLDACAALIATHGVSDHMILEAAARYCVHTDEGRTVLLTVVKSEGTGWNVEATVWRRRT
jgi:hypothetical protein